MSKNKQFCLIQLTRIGDIIQTVQAAQAIKKEHPLIELTLICRADFGKGLKFLIDKTFKETIYIDPKVLFAKHTLPGARESLNQLMSHINKKKYDVAFNFSFNKSSSYLLSMINADNKLGVHRNEQNQIVINDKWSQYIYSNVMGSSFNSIHLVDIYKNMLGAKKPNLAETKENISSNHITIHPFASHKRKMWTAHKWSELIYHILRNNPDTRINIVGGHSDRDSTDSILNSKSLSNFKNRIKSFVGIYDIEQSHKLVANSNLLICHDSMVSHLAALSSTPTIVLSLGTVRPDETTPYNQNVLNMASTRKCFPCNLNTQCELQPCHNDLSVQAIYKVTQMVIEGSPIDGETIKESISPFEIDKIKIMTPTFENKALDLVEISNTADTITSYFKSIYNMVWNYYLRNEEKSIPSIKLSDDDTSKLLTYADGIQTLFELYGFGMKFSKAICEEKDRKKPNVAKIQEHVDRITEIDRLINITKSTYPNLAPIVDFFTVIKANSTGANIFDVAQDNLLAYYEAQSITQIIFDLIEQTVGPQLSNNEGKSHDI